MKKLSVKIWMLLLLFITTTIVFLVIFTNFLYEELYVQHTEAIMKEVAENLQRTYEGGVVTDDFIKQTEDYNRFSDVEVFTVRNPRELSACLPFDIDYDTLIGAEERVELINGNAITKRGYEKRFDREVVSVIYPLVDENRLEGIIYIYVPLTKIAEMASSDVLFLIAIVSLLLICLAYISLKSLQRVLKPLAILNEAALDMAAGKYDTRVKVESQDEVGDLARSFNQMATSIQQEDDKKRNFLSVVSHELRTPISYIKGYGEAFEQKLIPEEKKAEIYNLIVREANRMQKLTNDLLTVARSETLEEVESGPLVLAETIREVIQLVKPMANEKEITFAISIDEETILCADEQKTKQVLINILENAIRYSSNTSKIVISNKTMKKETIIQVTDEGCGIEKEHLPHITERFYRVNKARSRSDGGTGLGLSIAAQLVDAQNGKLAFESEVGKGTTVYITLPIWEDLFE
ncbi:sensor histidine kinase [Psychrobacillus lasiicapitis]|uniref:histidine kinase n=1 Tax=Psychrobacillus lasiicapitis TaxID=1636719 RepID=A0A544SVB2_9BACI|nr:HAMP domain-containing sensor histidine kinase [Psychrobacillus lasiicapitis]TQR09145.1 HAMP domain-containing histidine kinase [Psychrobacillus lasiicapitis]GGA47869.1 two-component sensor histidine kinase [Psychrobacillus lasiicapitis]